MAKPQHPEHNRALEDRNDLPEGWIRIALQDAVSRIADGSHNPPKKQATGIPMLSARNIENGQIKFEDYRLISPREFESESKRTHIEPGDVFLTIVGSIGRSAVVPQRCERFALQRSVAVLKPVAIDPSLLMYELRAPFCQSFFEQEGAGTAQKGIYLGKLATLPVLLPPQAEQKRIVAKIEGLTARVEASLAGLAKVPAILKRFRQSVLAAACSGHLTADWRESHISKSSAEELLRAILLKRGDAKDDRGMHRSETLEADCSQVSDVPEEWALTSLDQLSCLITSGSRGWAKYYSDSGPLFIRAQDINTDRLRFDGIAHVRPPQNTEGSRTRVQVADLLVTVTGANVAKTALVDLDLGEAYVSQHVALVRPIDALVAPFVHLWIVSPSHGRKKLLGDAYGAGKPGLNLDNLREVVLALPPLAEQQEIVRRVETLFKLADGIEKRVATATTCAEKLTQSILAKAFRGELVPTEAELARREGREYEPAGKLLARIQTGDTQQGAIKRERRTRASAAILS